MKHYAQVSKRSRSILAGMATASLLAGLLAGCSGASTQSGGSSDVSEGTVSALQEIFGPGGKPAGEGLEISVGMDIPLTGSNAFVGESMQRGAELAAEQIKAAGGPNFKISIADHKGGDVTAGVSGAQRLINESNIVAMLSSYGNVTQGLVPIVQQNKILTFNGGGPDVTQAGKDYIWLPNIYFADTATPGELDYVAQTSPNAKRLALIGQTENGVRAFNELANKYWGELTGGEVVAKETTKVGQTDFSQLVARIKSSNPDVIWTSAYGADTGYIVKALRQAGITAPVIGQELSEDACTIAKDAFDTYLFGGSYFSPETATNPFGKVFSDTYQAKYNKTPEHFSAIYYEDLYMIWELVKRVISEGGDPNSGEALQKAITAKPEFASVVGGTSDKVGTLTMDPETHAGVRPMGLFSVAFENGACTPSQVATLNQVQDGQPAAGSAIRTEK